jgi:hypothetical protein
MKKLLIGLLAFGSISAFAKNVEILRVGIYTQVGSVTEFCNVNSAYLKVNGVWTRQNSNLGRVFKLDVPKDAKLLIRNASVGYSEEECSKIVIEREDGSEIRGERIPGTINFEINL